MSGNPETALPFFFPLGAYRQVKAISDVDGDYNNRLVANYELDIAALHKSLGATAGQAQFVEVQVPSAAAQWIKPGVEYNKGAYWRVYDSTVIYTVNGQRRSFPIKSMISWRGQWYVVHLTVIK